MMASEITPEKQASSGAAVEEGPTEYTHYNDVDLHDKGLNEQAKQGTAAEHSLGFVQAMKTYKRAAFWSARKFPA